MLSFRTNKNNTKTKKMNSTFDYSQIYYKVINTFMIHHGYKYEHGLNIDPIPFNTTKICCPGGFYFTNRENIPYVIDIGDYVCEVRIPEGTEVYEEKSIHTTIRKWKATQLDINLHGKIPFEEFEWKVEDVSKNGLLLRFIPMERQTEMICKAAIKQNLFALQYVKKDAEQHCFETIINNPEAINCVSFPKTQDFLWRIVQACPIVFSFIMKGDQTLDMCIFVLKYDGLLLQYVSPLLLTEELCKIAVENNCCSFQYVPQEFQSNEMCFMVLKQNGLLIKYIEFPTEDMCQIAVKQNVLAFYKIANPSEIVKQMVPSFANNPDIQTGYYDEKLGKIVLKKLGQI